MSTCFKWFLFPLSVWNVKAYFPTLITPKLFLGHAKRKCDLFYYFYWVTIIYLVIQRKGLIQGAMSRKAFHELRIQCVTDPK